MARCGWSTTPSALDLAFALLRLGGLGLQSAVAVAPAGLRGPTACRYSDGKQVLVGFGSLAAPVPFLQSATAAALAVFRSHWHPPSWPERSQPPALAGPFVTGDFVAGSGKRLLPLKGMVRRPRPCSPRPAQVSARPFRQPPRAPDGLAPSPPFPLPVTENPCRCHAVWTLLANIVQRAGVLRSRGRGAR